MVPGYLAYARLVRLPNVFTAFSDIAMAGATAYALAPPADDKFWPCLLLVALASGLLYMAGMVFNDVFDLEEDRKARSMRPLASGRISVHSAVVLGLFFSAIALLLALGAGASAAGGFRWQVPACAAALLGAILFYDRFGKRTPYAPLSMALCRALNVVFGFSVADSAGPLMVTHYAAAVGLYIVGVTWFARTEEYQSDPKHLRRASLVMLAAFVLALGLPVHRDPGTSWVGYAWVWAVLVVSMSRPVLPALEDPSPAKVQRAVKACVLGLVAFDATLATCWLGAPGLLILLLLVPGLIIGRWVYST